MKPILRIFFSISFQIQANQILKSLHICKSAVNLQKNSPQNLGITAQGPPLPLISCIRTCREGSDQAHLWCCQPDWISWSSRWCWKCHCREPCQVRKWLLMTPHADQDRCLPLAAGSFCTMKSFCGKKKIYKISFEIGILNFQHISIKGIWELFFLPIGILSTLGVQDATFCRLSSFLPGHFLLVPFAH